MKANLKSIDSAIFQTLEGLLAENGGAFQSVSRFASSPSGADRQREVSAATGSGTPAILLSLPGGTFAASTGLATVPGRDLGFVDSGIYQVIVAHTELSGHDTAITGQVDGYGILDLVDMVLRSLSGLRIKGLYRGSKLRPIDYAPVIIKPGLYTYLIRYSAQRFIDSAAVTDTSLPLEDSPVSVKSKAQDDTGAIVDGLHSADSIADLD